MRTRDLAQLGIPRGPMMNLAIQATAIAGKQLGRKAVLKQLQAIVETPPAFVNDAQYGELARALVELSACRARFEERNEPAPYVQWGEDLEPQSIRQMENACKLPIAVRAALMPDAHLGYGLPIGGVLATRNTVIPYAVGVDIACRVKLTVLDLPSSMLEDREDLLIQAIARETAFGIGAHFKTRRDHDVMDEDWSVCKTTAHNKDKAWKQLGSSGSGNHFVEFGELTLGDTDLELPEGKYLALLSHSGSRGVGASVAQHYSRLAMQQHPELPKELQHLAWLDLDREEGQEYWAAMTLMGKYAEANHACIHRMIARNLKTDVLLDIENHHNFAWKEVHDGEELIVHRKGATPAGEGVLGIIPGSMATATHIVRGKGNSDSMNSAAHGAGRVMSRTRAKKELRWKDAKKWLSDSRVNLLSAGLDEVPAVYKDIEKVMAAQENLVESIATFQPRIVKMAPAGEPAED